MFYYFRTCGQKLEFVEMSDTAKTRKVVESEEWQKARAELLVAEKALTAEHDRVATIRRNMPWMLVSSRYKFQLNDKTVGLQDLFAGRKQLIVYHHMFKPGDENPCSGCCMVIDNVGHLSHLHARDTSFAIVATASQNEIAAFQKRMQWSFTWASTTDDFNRDFDVTDGFGINVFIQQDDKIFRTYFTSGRGVEALGSNWSYLDITPLGRQESWEVSPPGTPQSAPYQWWRLHDLYKSS